MKAIITINFESNILGIAVQADVSGTRLFNLPAEGYVVDTFIKTGRKFPLSELEARSLHFKGSSPITWIENHMLDLLRLEGYGRGFDMRHVSFDIDYGVSFQQDESVDGGFERHVYRWVHHRVDDSLSLLDGQIAVIRHSVRGPQEYQTLGQQQLDIQRLAVQVSETAASE
jgi:hypothetical protein